jgi:hypothetical protein
LLKPRKVNAFYEEWECVQHSGFCREETNKPIKGLTSLVLFLFKAGISNHNTDGVEKVTALEDSQTEDPDDMERQPEASPSLYFCFMQVLPL